MAKSTLAQTQSQTQAQTLSLSPLQVMVARLLELTTVEFEDKVRSEVMDNPALETVEPDNIVATEAENNSEYDGEMVNSADDYRSEDDIPDYNGWDYRSHGETAEDIPVSADISFGDILIEQLRELTLTDEEKVIGEYLIGSLEEDGLLHKPISEIEDELIVYYDIYTDKENIEHVLKMIQGFDPAGIGARSLQECLMIQLERTNEADENKKAVISIAESIIRKCYDEFTKKRWDLIPEKLGISEEKCREAIEEIVHLNPRPGASLAESLGQSRQQIVPDFIVDIHGDSIAIQLNNMYVPELRVSEDYQRMLDEQVSNGNAEQKAAALFLKQKIEAAKGFISAIKQREQTLMDTMHAIVATQREFILSGGDETTLHPMILEDIAKRTGYDISTISRVTNSKYVQLPWGIFPLKHFFSDGVATSDGGERSVRELHRCLQELIDNENKAAPLTDTELMEKLKEQGFVMARRTVAKYREQLHIPIARLRRE